MIKNNKTVDDRRDLDCPACGSDCVSSVIDTRLSTVINDTPTIKRRRECDCGERFTTYEVTAKDIKKVKAALKLLDRVQFILPMLCLLYTSDAADE